MDPISGHFPSQFTGSLPVLSHTEVTQKPGGVIITSIRGLLPPLKKNRSEMGSCGRGSEQASLSPGGQPRVIFYHCEPDAGSS